MKSKKNLVLLGMMGSGKSTIGLIISRKLNLKFIDIDKSIEKKAKMTVKEIFKKSGEKIFRNMEEKITLKALTFSNTIISLGGGGFINDIIRNKIITENLSFWLNCDVFELLKRLKANSKRPLASDVSDDELIEMINKRSKVYSKAKFKINCQNKTKLEIAKKIINIYENN
jgi:shikimate kinase